MSSPPPPTCPICLSPPQGPFSTPCGHVFCYECITTHLQTRKLCPLCPTYLTSDLLTPHLLPPSTPPTRTPDITTAAHSSRRAAPPPLPRRDQPVPASPAAAAARRARAEARARVALSTTASWNPRDPAPENPPLPSPPPPSPPPPPLQPASLHPPSLRPPPLHPLPLPSPPRLHPNSHAHPSLPPSHPKPVFSPALPVAPASTSALPLNPAALLAAGDRLSAEQLAGVIAQLNQKLQQKAGSSRRIETELLLDFLHHTRGEKVRIIDTLREEVDLLDVDVNVAECERARLLPETSTTTSTSPHPEGPLDPRRADNEVESAPPKPDSELSCKRKRLAGNYDVLQSHYFDSVAKRTGEDRSRALQSFTDDIFKLTHYSRFRDRATLMHVARVPDAPCSDVFKASNIVSSIEFDRDSEFLATAGVTRRIKIFEFSNITRNLIDVHYPVREIPTSAKLSWVCWNPYIRHHLVSSDYEGFVTLWDVNRGVALREYEEHENRAWSVDYCPAKPTLFASGSDDGRVKLWTTAQRSSVLTIDNKPANVCSVKFHPTAPEKLAFGSVDFNVHYFDLRNPKEALQVFKSHSRAVSYVKFMSPTELVSASVDCTVKLWNLDTMSLERTFTGHLNDKNFVGLSVTSDYIACGSEENTVYCYYKAIPRPFTGYRFSSVDPLTGEETHDDDESQFVSSVCWCPNNPELVVAANSLGALKVLALDTGEPEDNDMSS